MVATIWTPPGPSTPTLRLTLCPRCSLHQTEVANVTFSCLRCTCPVFTVAT